MEPNTQQDPTGHKKTLLRHLIGVAVGGTAGKGLQEVISGIKTALSAYKNYSKEWDNLHGIQQPKPAPKNPAGSGSPGIQYPQQQQYQR